MWLFFFFCCVKKNKQSYPLLTKKHNACTTKNHGFSCNKKHDGDTQTNIYYDIALEC